MKDGKMAKPRLNPDFILVGVGGSVSEKVRGRLYAAAKREGVSVSGYIGRVLTDFADTLPPLGVEVDVRQERLLFSKHDTTQTLLEQKRLEKKGTKVG
jgi:hypothetical protein